MPEGNGASAKPSDGKSPNGNIPSYLSKFIGRSQDVTRVQDLLLGDSPRLITLTGPAGVGKTRLASKVAVDLYDTFKDGVSWVDLGSLTDPELVPHAAAAALGLPDPGSGRLEVAISNSLGSSYTLLVFDNCDCLPASCGRLARNLVQACPNLRILATSREALNVEEEVPWPVSGLTFPDEISWGIESNFLFEFSGYDALKLFKDRAMSALSVFRLTATSINPVIEICRKVEGMPLSIELAAASVRLMGVTRIAEQLVERIDDPNGSGSEQAVSNEPLNSVLGWSHDLLTDREKILLRRLSVFQDAFSLDAAEAIAGDDGLSLNSREHFRRDEILESLVGLIQKSFVVVDRPREERNAYRLLDAVRRYAAERLEDAGETEVVRDAHLHYYQQLVLDAERGLQGDEARRWIPLLNNEYDNLRSALKWAALRAQEDRRKIYSTILLDMTTNLFWFWISGNYVADGRSWLDQAATLPRKEKDDLAAAKALWSAGALSWKMGDLSAARHRLQESLELGSEWH